MGGEGRKYGLKEGKQDGRKKVQSYLVVEATHLSLQNESREDFKL